jgi:hypothetical protein
MTILCEKEYAEERLTNGFTRQGSFIDLKTVAKYFRYIGKDSEQTKQALVEFCKKFSSDYNEVIFERLIINAVRQTKDSKLRIYKPIGITKNELEAIRSVEDYRKQKILFVMLFFSKLFRSEDSDKTFYCNVSYTEILRIAKVKALAREKKEITHELNEIGFISTTRKGHYEILFADKQQKDFVLLVNNKEDIISHLLFKCPDCGKEMPIGAKYRKMCDECWKVRERELWKENKRKIRSKS